VKSLLGTSILLQGKMLVQAAIFMDSKTHFLAQWGSKTLSLTVISTEAYFSK
jgi:hypothetical protein